MSTRKATLSQYETEFNEDLERGFFANAWATIVAVAVTASYITKLIGLVTRKATKDALE